MAAINYKAGMLVEHPARPQWGVGTIVGVEEDRLHVYFKGEIEKKAKTFMRAIAPLIVAESQTDAVLDAMPSATHEVGGWELPRGYEKAMAKAAAAAAAE